MTRTEYADLWALRFLGAAEEAEIARLDSDLGAGIEACLLGRADAEARLGTLASTLSPVAPPAGARDRLLSAIREERSWTDRAPGATSAPPAAATPSADRIVPKPRRAAWLMPAALAATLVLMTGLVLWQSLQTAGDPVARYFAELARDPAATRLVLAEAESGRPLGTVWHDPVASRAHVFARGLPTPPQGKTYVLWTISTADPTKPKNVGVVSIGRGPDPDASLAGFSTLAGTSAFAISEETDPKTQSPTLVRAVAKAP